MAQLCSLSAPPPLPNFPCTFPEHCGRKKSITKSFNLLPSSAVSNKRHKEKVTPVKTNLSPEPHFLAEMLRTVAKLAAKAAVWILGIVSAVEEELAEATAKEKNYDQIELSLRI